MLNNSQTARRRELGWARIIGEEIYVVVRCVEIRMIEDIECIEIEAQPEPVVENKFFSQRHINFHVTLPRNKSSVK